MQTSRLALLTRSDNMAIQYQRQQADTKDNSPGVIWYQRLTLRIFAGENCNTFVLSFWKQEEEEWEKLWSTLYINTLLYGTNNILNTRIAIIKMQGGGKFLRFWMSLKMMLSRNRNLYEIHMSGRKVIKSKSGDGLSDSKPRWKYYTIMSFLDVSLMKRRYAPILFKNRFYINSNKMFLICSNSSKLINNSRYQFFVVVLYLMWLMLGVQMAVMMNK